MAKKAVAAVEETSPRGYDFASEVAAMHESGLEDAGRLAWEIASADREPSRAEFQFFKRAVGWEPHQVRAELTVTREAVKAVRDAGTPQQRAEHRKHRDELAAAVEKAHAEMDKLAAHVRYLEGEHRLAAGRVEDAEEADRKLNSAKLLPLHLREQHGERARAIREGVATRMHEARRDADELAMALNGPPAAYVTSGGGGKVWLPVGLQLDAAYRVDPAYVELRDDDTHGRHRVLSAAFESDRPKLQKRLRELREEAERLESEMSKAVAQLQSEAREYWESQINRGAGV